MSDAIDELLEAADTAFEVIERKDGTVWLKAIKGSEAGEMIELPAYYSKWIAEEATHFAVSNDE